jgi:hypothetical protein
MHKGIGKNIHEEVDKYPKKKPKVYVLIYNLTTFGKIQKSECRQY